MQRGPINTHTTNPIRTWNTFILALVAGSDLNFYK